MWTFEELLEKENQEEVEWKPEKLVLVDKLFLWKILETNSAKKMVNEIWINIRSQSLLRILQNKYSLSKYFTKHINLYIKNYMKY